MVKQNESGDLEKRSIDFLKTSVISHKQFSSVIDDMKDMELYNFLIEKELVNRRYQGDIPLYDLSQKGKRYAAGIIDMKSL